MRAGNPISHILKGRGTADNPPNRFERIDLEPDGEWLESERLAEGLPRRVATEFFDDHTRGAMASNDSPDVAFDFSVNPYRGCEHGCAYCYARPSHEFLGLSAGLDFETRIMVKRDAPQLLARAFTAKRWQPQVVGLSGITDCYQPVERKLEVTRGLLKVFLQFGNPVEIITKNALVVRDLDLLRELAAENLVTVTLSVTTLDRALSRDLEPRASTPTQRLGAIRDLSRAGVPVRVNVAPIIPGLNDHEIPAILAAAAEAGARSANTIMVRLPHGLKVLFSNWLNTHRPERAERVLGAIREVRGGALSDTRWGTRMRGEGPRAEAIAQLFAIHCRRHGLSREHPPLATDRFRLPAGPQLEMALGG